MSLMVVVVVVWGRVKMYFDDQPMCVCYLAESQCDNITFNSYIQLQSINNSFNHYSHSKIQSLIVSTPNLPFPDPGPPSTKTTLNKR